MAYNLLTLVQLSHEAQCDCKNRLPSLPRLHSPCSEGLAFADVLDVVDNGYVGFTSKHKIAVHTVDCEGWRNGPLGRREALRYDGATINTTSAGRMPKRPGVGEKILRDVVSVGITGSGETLLHRTGSTSISCVSCRLFSIADFDASLGGGSMSVAILTVRVRYVKGRKFFC